MFKKFIALALAVGSFAFAGEYWHLDPGGVTMKFLSMPVAPRAAALLFRVPASLIRGEFPKFRVIRLR